MMENKKYQEFWITKGSYQGDFYMKKAFYSSVLDKFQFDEIDDSDKSNLKHVIEYASYEELKADLKIAVDALNFYSEGGFYESPNFKNNLIEHKIIDFGEIAIEALSKIETKV